MFQVTKRGWDSSAGSAVEDDWGELLYEKNEDSDEDFELVVSAACDEVAERDEGVDMVDDDEGVEGEGAWRRDIDGGCNMDAVDVDDCSSVPANSSSRSSCESVSSVSMSSIVPASSSLGPSSFPPSSSPDWRDWY